MSISAPAKPTKQVITFRPDGSIEGLQFKGKGLDLRRFGRAKIERTSDILFDEELQKFTIKFLHGACAGQQARLQHVRHFGAQEEVEAAFRPLLEGEDSGTLLAFAEYDDAVKVEVILIQAARVAGLGHLIAPE